MINVTQGIPSGMSLSCPPPDENGIVSGLTTPAVPGQGVGSLMSSSRTSTHLKPAGVSGCLDRAQPLCLSSSTLSAVSMSHADRMSPIAATRQIPQKVTALTVITVPPVVVPPIITKRLSNLDLNGRLVKKGVTVSLAGFRYAVVKVNRGRLYGRPLALFGVVYPDMPCSWIRCESVQVVV